MSGSTGGTMMHSSQIWRRSPETSLTKEPPLTACDDAYSGIESREKAVRILMGSLSVLDWVRSQWLLGLYVLSIGLAYYFPAAEEISTSAWTRVLVPMSFMLTGASFPSFNKSTASRFIGPLIALCTACLVVPIILGAVIYTLFYDKRSNSEVHYLFTGLMCVFCLPPSAILSMTAVRVSQGNELLSEYLSAIGGVFGVVLSPLLIVTCISLWHLAKIPNVTEIMFFQAIVIGPFCVGLLLQKGYVLTSRYQTAEEDRNTVRLSRTEIACSELYEGSLVYWRRRGVQVNCLVMLLVSYFMFSTFFAQSTTTNPLTWWNVGLVASLETGIFIVLGLVHWLLASMMTDTPDERIALFFSLITKSEIFALPIILQRFHENRQTAVVLFPSLLYHLIQVLATGVLCFPVRRWRYHYNCRPGTTLLPLRLSKPTRAPSVGRL